MRIDNVYYVNLYLIDRGYGGPEEGGWWYDYGEFIETAAMFTREEEAYAFCQARNAETREEHGLNVGRPPISSVNSRGEYYFQVEDRPGKDFPEETIHYE